MTTSPTLRGGLVVGTGRCGSTLVSSMLREHPAIASVSELFSFITDLGNRIAPCFSPAPIGGPEFWQLVAGVHPRQNLLLGHGLQMPEVLYPISDDTYEFDRVTGVPAICATVLPHLFDDPDQAFRELREFIRDRGPAPIGDHYRALFAWLARRLGASVWVERSGGTLRIVDRLVRQFPEAPVLHIVRDGRNTAISMARHIGFRMALIGFQLMEFLGVDPFESDDRSEMDDLPDDLAALLPEAFTAAAFRDYDISPSLCGHYWSGEVIRGVKRLRELDPGRVITLRYEDLVTDPHPNVRAIAEHLAPGHPIDDAWVARCCERVGRGRSRWQELPGPERDELSAACEPGFAALSEIGLTWPD